MSINASATAAPFGLPFVTKLKGTAGSIVKQANLTVTVKTPSGELDPSFGNAGLAIANGGGRNLGVQSNDKIIMAKLAGPIESLFVELRHLNVNGSLDTNFGTGGIVTVNFPNSTDEFLRDMVITPDNKILLLLSTDLGVAPGDIVLLKLLANGQVDTSFGAAGIFTVPEPGGLQTGFSDIVLQKDGKIVVQGENFANRVTKIVVERVLANGSGLDTSFGSAGSVILSSLRFDVCFDMTLQADGKIVLVGISKLINDEDSIVVRLLSNGQLDNSFDRDGINRLSFGSLNLEGFEDVAVDSQGRIVAAGTSYFFDGKLTMARFGSTGKLDDSFDGNGKLERALGTVGATMVLQPDDKQIIISGEVGSDRLIRQTVSGALDTSFASTGIVTLPNAINDVSDMVLDSKGRIIVLGDDGVARYVP